MGKVLVIFTGGTIASGFLGDRKGPDPSVSRTLQGYVSSFFEKKGVEVVCLEPWGIPGLDSSNLDPGHWIEMARIIERSVSEGTDGVLILHGTDTMAHSAAWLSLCFSGVGIPIILTGSQLTLDYTPEDVTVNLRGAAQVVCSDLTGVWIYCNWKLVQGNRAHKARAQHPDAFIPIGGLPLYFSPEWARDGEITDLPHPRGRMPYSLKKILGTSPEEARKAGKSVRWLLCAPGTDPVPSGNEKIIGLLGFGAGNAPTSILEKIASFYPDKEKPQIIACSQAEGDVKDPAAYHDVGIAGLSSRGFDVWGQMDYPVEFIHALCCYSLMASPQDPGKVLGKFLKKYQVRVL